MLTVFLENITPCACFYSLGLKIMFHLCAQWAIIFILLSSWLTKILGSCTVKNNDLSSTNSLTVDCNLSGRSFMYIRKKKWSSQDRILCNSS